MQGAFSTTAMFSASKVVPWLAAPSPEKATATLPVLRYFCVSAAPTAMGGEPPTMALAPSMPFFRSAMCMEPPLPPQRPSALPMISSIMPFTSTPLAMQWPWPRWVEPM